MAVRRRPLIFLDVDGVLNSRPFLLSRKVENPTGPEALDPQAVQVLEKIQQEFDPDWVLSSSWRHCVKAPEMTLMLRDLGWTGTVVDTTPLYGDHRGAEILQWLEKHDAKDRPFVILDDDADMDPLLGHLVQTSFATGLQPIHVESVRRKLRCTLPA